MRASLRLAQIQRYTLAAPSALVRARGGAFNPALDDDFAIYPDFFSPAESRALLGLALWKLDRADSKRRRRRRGGEEKKEEARGAPLQDMFMGPYGFEEGHFDSVIHNYRESLVTSLPPDASAELASVLGRLYRLVPGLKLPASPTPADLPPEGSSTHALHLAPEGAILAHVDNLEASGQTIVGASLGAARILRLDKDGEGWDVLLPSGSVYMQKGRVRYDYTHAVLGFTESRWEGVPLPRGHRVSFMVRDAPARPAQL
ncbi:hypothetical protein CC85DRAFT_112688 [Cutaneotrichosporon oleaginosum]|uniref:Alpha-ketoglutarate-dependent dioxygenase AlkB-like domain-containing protein n=1 Tax=Cutaneotrichosporon oleaginosum TaxID=879819 RepID=A0A0J0XX64_9TREE|nr:uncharacterized protein CC85DRAFT_112688 [Cutaneotrichosporon oleaginosum]KLT45640.1 hypothetical protein CC85DRAFT_112688 [Cutaneotrichosporon oleaginosum]TXT04567.1 hypothetical protein COLE_07386 [Cutaneotrichosporon oleaginosum]